VSKIRESCIENHLVRRVEDAGGEVRKLKWIGRRNAPDRVVLLNGAHFVELKRPGKEATPQQSREHLRLARQDVSVWVLSTLDEVDEFIRRVTS